ncbi:MAG: hypothetical protein OXC91_00810 [Rhodobacteraceae bacterium]|nr:hypothetical protein [Paracoccaceae bacterium]
MKLQIRNLLNHADLEIEIKPGINLITGENGDGKTNLSRIIGAMAAHTGNPAGLSSAQAKAYITDGKTEGYAQDDRGVRWVPPARFVVPDGVKKLAHPHTVNLVDFIANATSTDRKKRSESYESLFLPKDPAALLKPAWQQRGLPDGQLKTVLEMVKNPKQGWNAAQKMYADKARECKSHWGNVTGQRWGAQKAPKWKPEDWESDMEGLSEDDVLQALTDAQEALRAIGVKHAVGEDRIARAMQVRNEEIPAKKKELGEAAALFKETSEAFKAAKSSLDKLRETKTQAWEVISAAKTGLAEALAEQERLKNLDYPSCWNCGVKNEIVSGAELKKPAVDDGEIEKELDSWRENALSLQNRLRDEAEPAYERATAKYNEAAKGLAELQKTLRAKRDKGIAVKAELEALEKRAEDADAEPSKGNALERSAAEIQRDKADRRRKAWTDNDKAQKLHNDVVGYTEIEELLRPTGVREAVIGPRMDKLRACLTSINNLTGWNHIGITKDYEVISNDRPVGLVSQHEQYQAQWALQCAITMLVPSTRFVVLDCCDIVRGGNWEGLVNLVNRLALKREKDIERLKGEGKAAPPPLCIVVCATETEAPDGWHEIWLGEET